MAGNVAEWTRSAFRPYPYDASDGREYVLAPGLKVARGGSWRDLPKRASASFRLPYQPYQPVFNVGFRVVCESDVRLSGKSVGGERTVAENGGEL